MTRLSILALASAFALSACGEKPQVVVYKQGHYQGKADEQPWDSEVFKGDRDAWEKAIKTRNMGQHEYKRTQ